GPAEIGVNTLPLMFGGQPGGENPLHGTVDDVRIYQRALEPSEVAELVADAPTPEPEPVPDAAPEPGGVGFWSFEEAAGMTSFDTSGAANHGVASGGVVRSPGALGRGFAFDGVTGRITVPDAASLDL